jgi:hypothetical protein
MPSVDAINWMITGATVMVLWVYSKVVGNDRKW